MSYNSNLKLWGDSGTEYPDGYSYNVGEQPVDEWDNFLISNLIKDINYLVDAPVENFTTTGSAGTVPIAQSDGSISMGSVSVPSETQDTNMVGGYTTVGSKSGETHSSWSGGVGTTFTVGEITDSFIFSWNNSTWSRMRIRIIDDTDTKVYEKIYPENGTESDEVVLQDTHAVKEIQMKFIDDYGTHHNYSFNAEIMNYVIPTHNHQI